MQTQDPNVPEPESFPKQEVIENKSTKKESSSIAFASITIFILMALGIIIFLYNQNQELKKIVASYQQKPNPTVVATPTPQAQINMPIVNSPVANSLVKSPLKVTGSVPSGFMFEGVFPIRLVDANNKLITQGQAKENIPGSWLSDKPATFSATLTFKTSTESGYLVLQNDNPSGDPDKSITLSIPVKFKETNTQKLTCPSTEYIDCMPTPDAGVKYECSPDAITWYQNNCPDFKGVAY